MSERWHPDEYVANYRNAIGVIKEFIFPFLEYIEIENEDWVLEVGVGSGKWSAAFAIMGCNVVGVDNHPGMLDRVRLNFPAISRSMILVLDDARTLNNIPNQFFDIVVSEGLVEHFLDDDERLQVMRNMAVKLKPTESVLICVVPYNSKEEDEHCYENHEELVRELESLKIFNNLQCFAMTQGDEKSPKLLAVLAGRFSLPKTE